MLFILVLGSVPALFAVVVPRHRIKMSSATTSPAQKLGNHIFTERRNEPEIVSVETLADSWFGRGQVDLADLQLYEAIAGPFDRERVVHLFKQKPMIVGRRLLNVFLTLQRIRQDWENQSSEERGSMLCSRLSALGPVATKVGQTLSQRPDMVGEEAAEALQSLQSQNTQRFSNADALHLLEKDWGKDRSLWPVRFLSIEPVAVASLGQVYKGELEDGRQVAVKIQRPDALKSCALDFACFALALAALEAYWRWKNGFDNGDLSQVVDMVAQGIFQELDYRLEAQNAIEFESSLNFLGFVSVPKPILEDNTTTRQILITEWCDGKRLDELDSAAEKRAMARRAVTACTASLVLTGFNHCDPHQGNILYIPQNKELVFLDFGLVSRVDPYVMEQFATGIRACVAGDYDTLASVFQSVGFLGTPLQYREHVGAKWQILGRDGVKQFATDLRRAMARADGGTQRFGALANVLGRDLGKQYKMFTPPYCILLTRTFLTLEGICARADPDFNIYQASMPWALQRALTPTTPDGVRALRSILFDNSIGASTGKLRFQELVQQFFLQEEAQEIESPASVQKLNQNIEQDEAEKRQKDAIINAVVASPSGAALRRAISDVDATDLVSNLSGRHGRPVRRALARTLCDALDTALNERTQKESSLAIELHPMRRRRQKKITETLIQMQLKRIFGDGGIVKGVLTITSLGFVFVRVVLSAFALYLRRHLNYTSLRAARRTISLSITRFFPGRRRPLAGAL